MPRMQKKSEFVRELSNQFSSKGSSFHSRNLILNRWNVSCSCPRKGFEWNSLYGMCVDVDECALGAHRCDRELEVCVNLPGNFKCACKWGHTFNKGTRKCSPSAALSAFILNRHNLEENNKTDSIWSRIYQVFTSGCTQTQFDYRHYLFILGVLFFNFVD